MLVQNHKIVQAGGVVVVVVVVELEVVVMVVADVRMQLPIRELDGLMKEENKTKLLHFYPTFKNYKNTNKLTYYIAEIKTTDFLHLAGI